MEKGWSNWEVFRLLGVRDVIVFYIWESVGSLECRSFFFYKRFFG